MDKSIMSRLTNGENLKTQGLNTVYVAMGLIGATAIDRLVQKAADKWFPSIAPYVSYVKPALQVLGGFGMSLLAEDKTATGDRMKLIGYGISSAGLISGLRLIPAIDKLMSDTPPAVAGLNGVDGLLSLNLGDFGNAENIRQVSTADAQQINLDLPDLGRTSPQSFVYDNENANEAEQFGEVMEVFAEVI
jgi:hypothetical protein